MTHPRLRAPRPQLAEFYKTIDQNLGFNPQNLLQGIPYPTTALTANQNWSRSSFPKPLNKGIFTIFSILNCGGGGHGTSDDGGDGGGVGGGVGRGGIRGNTFLIN